MVGYCLVSGLRNRRLSVKRLIRSLEIIVVHKLYDPLEDGSLTPHPHNMKAVATHCAGSLNGVNPTAPIQEKSAQPSRHGYKYKINNIYMSTVVTVNQLL